MCYSRTFIYIYHSIIFEKTLFYAPIKKRGHFVLHLSVSRSVSLDPFARKLPNLVLLMPLKSRWPLSMFKSHGQRSRSNCWSLKKCCLLNISWFLNLVQWLPLAIKCCKWPLLMSSVNSGYGAQPPPPLKKRVREREGRKYVHEEGS